MQNVRIIWSFAMAIRFNHQHTREEVKEERKKISLRCKQKVIYAQHMAHDHVKIFAIAFE